MKKNRGLLHTVLVIIPGETEVFDLFSSPVKTEAGFDRKYAVLNGISTDSAILDRSLIRLVINLTLLPGLLRPRVSRLGRRRARLIFSPHSVGHNIRLKLENELHAVFAGDHRRFGEFQSSNSAAMLLQRNSRPKRVVTVRERIR